MATYKTTGLVLGRTNLGEADRIITFLTPDRGRLRAVARGVRRSQAKLAGHLELFSQTELMLAEGRNLDVVTSARLISYPENLTADWQALSYAYLAAEMLMRLAPDEAADGLYQLAAAAVRHLAGGASGVEFELGFKLRLLGELGYQPDLDACVVCRKPWQAEGHYWFNPELGGLVDVSCVSERQWPMTADMVRAWRRLSKQWPAEVASGEGLAAIDSFYDYLFGLRFKSRQMLAAQ